MFNTIIKFSLENKLIILAGVVLLTLFGVYSATKIPLDAVPDITNNQVQIVSTAPTFAPEEVEQLITYPLEAGMTNIPDVTEVRSISRYGLSVITIVFEESVDIMLARQFVREQLDVAKTDLPEGIEPELMPITTGLGEVYQYVLTVDEEHAHLFDATELRTIQDWIVKRQLNGTKGIIETSSFGGYLKQYEVAVDPNLLKNFNLTLQDVITALEENNQNSGGSYIEKGSYSYYIRMEGRAESMEALANIPLRTNIPIRIKDVATIRIGSAKRYGGMTMDGKGEVVGGITLMLKGDNSSEALENVKERITDIQASLPKGVSIYPYLDRSKLIGNTINTVRTNLIEGGLIVIFVLLLLLGNFRAGLIVASVIPLSMLFAMTLMNYFGVSANLMSLGAIDFGIVIDGAVIIVESLLHTLTLGYLGQKLSHSQMDEVVKVSTSKIYRSAAFGVLIILLVFVPILTLEGTEGKTFRPMAQTVGFAILGSLILSITYVPVMASLFLKKEIKPEKGFAFKIMSFLKKIYQPGLQFALKNSVVTLLSGLIVFAFSILVFSRMGAEFIPTLEEGDIAMQQSIKPGSSLSESIHTSTMAEKIILDNFPEVEHVVSKIGTAEVPTDPMAIEDADIMIILKDKSEWTTADNREELIELMKEKLEPITWASFEFTQPIQLRFNELMTGAKSDISVKLFGEDVAVLKEKADQIAESVRKIKGAGDVKVDQTDGLQQLSVRYNRNKMAQHGITISDVNQIIRAAYAGEIVGDIFEEERKFDLVVRLAPDFRQNLDLDRLTIANFSGSHIPLSEVAKVVERESPMLISREQARRFINIGINVRNRDVASLVEDIQNEISANIDLPPGYEIQYGGQFENLENARKRLIIAVPAALLLILFLLYLAFGSAKDALIIFIAVPLSAIGGIWALQLRGMPFSISSGIGFIALFGISVLNGIVLISAIKELNSHHFKNFKALITKASVSRLRPVLMTALVAAFGFLPMAVSTGSGAEVQQPLATVVIGGLISSTLLTLLILPALYYLVYKNSATGKVLTILFFTMIGLPEIQAQNFSSFEEIYAHASANHPQLKNQILEIEKEQANKKAAAVWSPVEIGYQGGQINYSGFDHFFSINQNLNHFFGKKDKLKVIDNKVAVLENDRILLANDLKFSIRKKYDELVFLNAEMRVIEELVQWYDSLDRRVKLQFSAGEISRLDIELSKMEVLKLNARKTALQTEITEFEAALKTVAFLPEQATFQYAEPEKIPVGIFDFDEEKSLYVKTFLLKKKVLEQQATLAEKQGKRPDLNVGYFLQSLEKDFSFQGLSVGLAVPLDRRSIKASQMQFDLSKIQLENEAALKSQTFARSIRSLKNSIAALQKTIEQYESQMIPAQTQMEQITKLQLREGEIDFFKFIQIQQMILDEKQAHLHRLKSYNSKVLELIYLTQTI